MKKVIQYNLIQKALNWYNFSILIIQDYIHYHDVY